MQKKTDFEAAIKRADEVYLSLQTTTEPVAAVAKPSHGAPKGAAKRPDLDSSADAPALQQVAAMANRGRYPPRKQQAGGAQGKPKSDRGKPMEPNTPKSACNTHWKYGRAAYTCRKKDSCPWAHFADKSATNDK